MKNSLTCECGNKTFSLIDNERGEFNAVCGYCGDFVDVFVPLENVNRSVKLAVEDAMRDPEAYEH